jgi:hypothetical protein
MPEYKHYRVFDIIDNIAGKILSIQHVDPLNPFVKHASNCCLQQQKLSALAEKQDSGIGHLTVFRKAIKICKKKILVNGRCDRGKL